MKDIKFTCYAYGYTGKPKKFLHFPPDKTFTIFLFYKKGKWDENKLSIDEALKMYPVHKYNWIYDGD